MRPRDPKCGRASQRCESSPRFLDEAAPQLAPALATAKRAFSGFLWSDPDVGQPILAAAAFQAAPHSTTEANLVDAKPRLGNSRSRGIFDEPAHDVGPDYIRQADFQSALFEAYANLTEADWKSLEIGLPVVIRLLFGSSNFHMNANDRGRPRRLANDAGTRYLRFLMSKYRKHGNSLSRVIAAYNAGPGAVDRYHGVPPFRETRCYVVRVMTFLRQFRKELG